MIRTSLEFQASLAGAISKGFYTPDVLETTAVENDLGDPFVLGALGYQLANLARLIGLGHPFDRVAQLVVNGRGGSQGAAGFIIDDLSINFSFAAINSQARAGLSSGEVLADPVMPANSGFSTR